MTVRYFLYEKICEQKLAWFTVSRLLRASSRIRSARAFPGKA